MTRIALVILALAGCANPQRVPLPDFDPPTQYDLLILSIAHPQLWDVDRREIESWNELADVFGGF